MSDSRRPGTPGGRLGPWVLAGALAWAGLVWLGWSLWQQAPHRAGFDLALLLDGARRVAAGGSPYDAAMLAGTSPDATSLFYSYPPPVAQAMTLLAWLPDGVVLLLWGLGAATGLGVAAGWIARAAGRDDARTIALKAVLAAPLVLPFAIAILFGNLDAWYPLAFGALVVALLPGASARSRVAGGIALGVVAVAKLHPASLLAWLAVRVVVERGGPSARILGAALVTGAVIVLASVVVGGPGPWSDYATVVRAGAGAAVVDPRNIGPVSLLGQVVALGPDAIRAVQVVVALAAVAVTALAAARVRDPLASIAIATTASLVVLPVTWYHYPVALVPVAIALALRGPASRWLTVAATVVADVAIGLTPMLWLGVAVLLAGASRRVRRDIAVPTPARS